MIHKYQSNGYNIALDVHSGAVHILDDLSFSLLDYLQPPLAETCPEKAFLACSSHYTNEEICEAYQELYSLYQGGQLFTEDDYAPFANMMVAPPIKAM